MRKFPRCLERSEVVKLYRNENHWSGLKLGGDSNIPAWCVLRHCTPQTRDRGGGRPGDEHQRGGVPPVAHDRLTKHQFNYKSRADIFFSVITSFSSSFRVCEGIQEVLLAVMDILFKRKTAVEGKKMTISKSDNATHRFYFRVRNNK